MGTSKKQTIFVFAVASAVIAGLVLVVLYSSGRLWQSSIGGSVQGYQSVTFTDAVLACQRSTRSSYGTRVRGLFTDNHSSRFDEKQYLYKIFLKMDLYDDETRRGRAHHVNCFVRSSNGAISKFEVYAMEEGRPVDTNMFGMPRSK